MQRRLRATTKPPKPPIQGSRTSNRHGFVWQVPCPTPLHHCRHDDYTMYRVEVVPVRSGG